MSSFKKWKGKRNAAPKVVDPTKIKTRMSLITADRELLPVEQRIEETKTKKLTRNNDYLDPDKVFAQEELDKIVIVTSESIKPTIQINVAVQKSAETAFPVCFYTPPLYCDYAAVCGTGNESPYFAENGYSSNSFSLSLRKGAPKGAHKKDPTLAGQQVKFFDGLCRAFKTIQNKAFDKGDIQPTKKGECITAAQNDLADTYGVNPGVIKKDPKYSAEVMALARVKWSQLIRTPLDEKTFNPKTGFEKIFLNPPVFHSKSKDAPNSTDNAAVAPPKSAPKKPLASAKDPKSASKDVDEGHIDPESTEAIIKQMKEDGCDYNRLQYEDCQGNRIPNPISPDESVLATGSLLRMKLSMYFSSAKNGAMSIQLNLSGPIRIFRAGKGAVSSVPGETSHAALAWGTVDPNAEEDDDDFDAGDSNDLQPVTKKRPIEESHPSLPSNNNTAPPTVPYNSDNEGQDGDDMVDTGLDTSVDDGSVSPEVEDIPEPIVVKKKSRITAEI